MNNRKYVFFKIHLLLAAILSHGVMHVAAQPRDCTHEQPRVNEEYRSYFRCFDDDRSWGERVLNAIGLSREQVGRSIALIGGISEYKYLSGADRTLPQARGDVDRLVDYLRDEEAFDEIIVLLNQDFNYDNIQFFLQSYIPERLKSPKSRFLFAYSGHGFNNSDERRARKRGYIVGYDALSMSDTGRSLELKTLRNLIDHAIDQAYQSLVLLNTCYSGTFLSRSFTGTNAPPSLPGAYALTSSGPDRVSWACSETGSVFFDVLLEGLGSGRADLVPAGGDGVVTIDELETYMKDEISNRNCKYQDPRGGDLYPEEPSPGGFFFVNASRKVDPKTLTEPDNHGNARSMGPRTIRELRRDAERAKEIMLGEKEKLDTVPYRRFALSVYVEGTSNGESGDGYFERATPEGYREAEKAYKLAASYYAQAREQTHERRASVLDVIDSITPEFEESIEKGDIDRLDSLFVNLRDRDAYETLISSYKTLIENNKIQKVTLTWGNNWEIEHQRLVGDATAVIDYKNRRNEPRQDTDIYTLLIKYERNRWIIEDYEINEHNPNSIR